MKSKGIGSSKKIRPVLPIFVHQEMLHRRNSVDSFSNMSIGDVSGVLNENSPSDPEKKLDYYPDLSYSAPDTKVKKGLPSSPSPSSVALSSASSITYLSPARTRQNSDIEFSSPAQRDSSYSSYTESIYLPPTSKPSESQQPQPTEPAGHSAV